MNPKTKVFIASLTLGSLLTILVNLTTYLIEGYFPSNGLLVIADALMLFYYSIMSWGAFFYKRPAEEPFFSSQLFRSAFLGLLITGILIGTMLLFGKLGSPHPLALRSLKELNTAGIPFIWLLLSGLHFEKISKNKEKNNKNTA